MPRGTQLSIVEQTKIDVYRESGNTIREIAFKLNRSKTTIQSYLRDPISYRTVRRPGPTPVITEDDKREIKSLAASENISCGQIKSRINVNVTVRRINQILTQDCSITKNNIFSDEKKFNPDGPNDFQGNCLKKEIMEESNRQRKTPSKKWKDSELLKILNFIIIDPHSFEKPTAQIYYKNMIKEIQIPATWDLVKWKMRYHRIKYKKALEWKKSALANLEYDYQDKISHICPHFDLLSQIFGNNQHSNFFEVSESSELYLSEDTISDSKTFFKNETSEPTVFEITYDRDDLPTTSNSDDYGSSSLLSENLTSPTTSNAAQVVVSSSLLSGSSNQVLSTSTTPAINNKNINSTSKTSVKISNPRSVTSSGFLNSTKSDLNFSSQSEQFNYLETNLDLQRRKIDIEEYKIKREFDLEEKKLQQNFELRKLEIAKDERLAKYEIEMKYKYKSNNMDLN